MKQVVFLSTIILVVLGSAGIHAADDANADTTLFFVLGMLEDYAGRRIIESDSLVERFYPHEKISAAIFEKYLAVLLETGNAGGTVHKKIRPQGHIEFYSESLAELINSCFMVDSSMSSGFTIRDGKQCRMYASTSLEPSVRNPSADEKLAYLRGAYIRNGLGHTGPDSEVASLHFANTTYKRDLIASFLQRFECDDVRAFIRYGIPTGSELLFYPSPVIQLRVIEEAHQEYVQTATDLQIE